MLFCWDAALESLVQRLVLVTSETCKLCQTGVWCSVALQHGTEKPWAGSRCVRPTPEWDASERKRVGATWNHGERGEHGDVLLCTFVYFQRIYWGRSSWASRVTVSLVSKVSEVKSSNLPSTTVSWSASLCTFALFPAPGSLAFFTSQVWGGWEMTKSKFPEK